MPALHRARKRAAAGACREADERRVPAQLPAHRLASANAGGCMRHRVRACTRVHCLRRARASRTRAVIAIRAGSTVRTPCAAHSAQPYQHRSTPYEAPLFHGTRRRSRIPPARTRAHATCASLCGESQPHRARSSCIPSGSSASAGGSSSSASARTLQAHSVHCCRCRGAHIPRACVIAGAMRCSPLRGDSVSMRQG